jgi:cytochrome c biogenesis protein CcdA/thiol-disulfide isomerase/thioredoxin
MLLLMLFSFLAGFVTIFSPCILSIAPILFTAGSDGNHKKPLGIVTGLIISFSFFTLTLSSIIKATGISPDIFRYIALVVVIFFGLTMIVPSLEHAFTRLTEWIARAGNFVQEHSIAAHTHFISGFVLGIALGLLWTPCAGPILATITTLAAAGHTTFSTILITLAYTTGAAIPMLLFCFGGSKIMDSLQSVAPYTHTIRQIFGIIAIISAIAIAFNFDIMIEEKIAHWFPTISFERNTLVEKELNKMRKPNTPDQALALRSLGEVGPEITGISTWLNSEPLTLAQLRGKVVLLDFWTYTCINCVRTLPHVKQWYESYKNEDFIVIGIHTPEFAFEKTTANVENAVKRFGITYPVALDNDYQTWRAYNNHYWPAHYLIDQNGTVVKTHFGEGGYVEMEDAIRALLNIPPCKKTESTPYAQPLTPETYLGFDRASNYHPSLQLQKNSAATYHTIGTLGDNEVGLQGSWIIESEFAQSNSDTNTLELNFVASHVYLVMQSDKPVYLTVLLDGKPVNKKYYSRDMDADGKILVHQARMYEIIDLKEDYARHTLALQCPKGINAYVFTFGS